MCVAMAAGAIVLYSWRVLVDAASITRSSETGLLDDVVSQEIELRGLYEDEVEKAHNASLSPVLAFFQHDHHHNVPSGRWGNVL